VTSRRVDKHATIWSPERERLRAFLARVRSENGDPSLREIASRIYQSHSRVSAYLNLKSRIPEDRLVALVQTGLGGSQEDADEARRLLAAIPLRRANSATSSWEWAGPDAKGHFTRRAYGHRPGAWGTDLFRGRHVALSRIVDWLSMPKCPGEPLVVVGQPGSGKSAVVGRVTLHAQELGLGVERGLAVHGRGMTVTDVVEAVARLTGHPKGIDRFELMQSLHDVDGGRVWPVVVDALDEAHSSADRSAIAELLVDLASMPCFRVIVATRPHALDGRYSPRTLLRSLSVTGSSNLNLIDLDTAKYLDRESLVEFAAALLSQDGMPNAGPPGRAWQRFRADADLKARLAALIAQRADNSYLVAALAAYELSTARVALDPAAGGFTPASIPASIGEAIDKYLDTLPDSRRTEVECLLTALAYAKGAGVEDAVWVRLANALGYPNAKVADLNQIRGSAAVDYLLQVSPGGDGEPVTRLFHQALADDLLLRRGARRIADERAIVANLIPVESADWNIAGRYVKAHVAEHAEVAGVLSRLLQDPCYLAVADIDRLLPVLPARPPCELQPIVTVLHRASSKSRALPPHRRLRLMALTASHLGHDELRQKFVAGTSDSRSVLWAHSLGNPHQQLPGDGDDAAFYAAAIGSLGGRDVVVAGEFGTGVLRVWDAAGSLILGPIDTGTSTVLKVALGSLGGRELIVSLGGDGVVRLWDAEGVSVGELAGRRAGRIEALAMGSLDGREVIVTGGDDGLVVWNADGHHVKGHAGQVETLAIGSLDGRDVIVFGGLDGAVHICDVNGLPVGEPFARQAGSIEALALGRFGDRDIIVSARGGDGAVCAWDADGHVVVGPLSLPFSAVRAVAVGRLSGRDVIVSGGGDGVVRVWDGDGQLAYELRDGRSRTVECISVGCLNGRDVVVSCGESEVVRVWDLDACSVGEPLGGHGSEISAVAAGRLGDDDVVVSADYDGAIRIWDTDGNAIGAPIDSGTSMVVALAIGRLDNRGVIVSGSVSGSVGDSEDVMRVWGTARELIWRRSGDHYGVVESVAVGRFGGSDVVISAGCGPDGGLRMWSARGELVDKLTGMDSNSFYAVTMGTIDGWDAVVAGGYEGVILVREEEGHLSKRPVWIHKGQVSAVAVGCFGGRDVIACGTDSGDVLLCDANGESVAKSICRHAGRVSAVAISRIGDRDAVLSAGSDGKVSISFRGDTQTDIIDLLEAVNSVSFVPSSDALYVATGPALSRWRL